jgi:energy-coupling factor transporter ATP-binding protein EcfA2
MTKPALQHLKESFSDLDEKEMDKMVEVMKRYARECIVASINDIIVIASEYIKYEYGEYADKVENYKIETP